ncbi:uncharacterized protein LOC143024752 [Oratosquilla oratoria]|uniref:uncharacterized protein LOC143024752 n=1 Tax=Oratosquilla oratoria TaxID=337810 RepID=UPI003F76C7D3
MKYLILITPFYICVHHLPSSHFLYLTQFHDFLVHTTMNTREMIPTMSGSPKRYHGTKSNFSSLGDLPLLPSQERNHPGYRERSVDVEIGNRGWPMVRERSVDTALSDGRRAHHQREKSLVKSLDDVRSKDDNFVRESQNALRRSTRRSRKRERKPRGTRTGDSPERTSRERSQASHHTNRARQSQSRNRSRSRDFDSSSSSDNVTSWPNQPGRAAHADGVRTRGIRIENRPFGSSHAMHRMKENPNITSLGPEYEDPEPLKTNSDNRRRQEIELTMPGNRNSLKEAFYEGLGGNSGASIPSRKRPEEMHALPPKQQYRYEGVNHTNVKVSVPYTNWETCNDSIETRNPNRQNQTTQRPPVPLPRTGSISPSLKRLKTQNQVVTNTPYPSNGNGPPPYNHKYNYKINSNIQTRNLNPSDNLDCSHDEHDTGWNDSEEGQKLIAGRYEGISAICHFICIALCLIVIVPMAGVAAAWENQRKRCPMFVKATPEDNVQWGNESIAPCNYVAFMPVFIIVLSLALLVTHGSLLYNWHSNGNFPELLVTRKYSLLLLAFNFFEFILMFSVACTMTDGFRQTCLSFELSPYPENRPENCKMGFSMRDKAYSLEELHTFARFIVGMIGAWLCSIILFFITLLSAVRGKLCSCNMK